MRRIRICSIACIVLSALLPACGYPISIPLTSSPEQDRRLCTASRANATADTATVRLAKWHNNATAALTLTYDHGWSGDHNRTWEKDVERLLRDSSLVMDFDWTPHYIGDAQYRYAKDTLLPHGISFFGHGFYHINTDALSEDSARTNFRLCAESMLRHGIQPIAYAYPGGYGFDAKTRRACKEAGFLSARLFSLTNSPYIIPDSSQKPLDWYALPTVPMFSAEYVRSNALLANAPRNSFVATTDELVPYLDQTLRRSAWLILTYHHINNLPDGSYRFSDFVHDVRAVKARPFWVASINTITLYLRERVSTRLVVSIVRDSTNNSTNNSVNNSAKNIRELLIIADDSLPDNVYNVPLSMLVDLPASWAAKRVVATSGTVPLRTQRLNEQTLLVMLVPSTNVCTLKSE